MPYSSYLLLDSSHAVCGYCSAAQSGVQVSKTISWPVASLRLCRRRSDASIGYLCLGAKKFAALS